MVLNAEFINPFLTASEKIVKMVLSLELTLGSLSLKKEHDVHDILLIIIWVKGDYYGRVMFCIQRPTACTIASKMMGQYISHLDDLSKSAVGELANMILGRSSTIFSNRGINVTISPPTIIEGNILKLSPVNNKVGIINIPLRLSSGDIIDLEMEISKAQ